MLKKKITTLINLIEGTEIEEIEVSSFWGAQKIKLSKGKTRSAQINVENKLDKNEEINQEVSGSNLEATTKEEPPISESPKEKDEEIILSDSDNFYEVKAPLVVTYYSSQKPGDPPFVNVGDKVTKGQVLCIIEAMKIFNEIESEVTGIVKDICVENGNPVEFDQLILKISPE